MKTTLTYSAWNMFRNCPRAYEWRYEKHLVPLQANENLMFGSVIHKCLELWYKHFDAKQVYAYIDNVFPQRIEFLKNGVPNLYYIPEQKTAWQKAQAMMDGYFLKYPEEPFDVFAVEDVFGGDIINPATQAKSKKIDIKGKVDGIVKMKNSGEYYLLEHKTASIINDIYLAKLPCDTQITLYTIYAEKKYNIPIAGIIYNILGKTKTIQEIGETEEEFRIRYAEACAKNKSGKSSATRKLPESDELFQARLAGQYSTPDTTKFHRETLILSDCAKSTLQRNLWSYTQQLLQVKRSGYYPQNHSSCFNQYQRACDYFPICYAGETSGLVEQIILEKYVVKPPHVELREEKEEKTIFALTQNYSNPPIDITDLSKQKAISKILLAS